MRKQTVGIFSWINLHIFCISSDDAVLVLDFGNDVAFVIFVVFFLLINIFAP